jgi:uncharacterized protein (TIGR02996 family)
VVSKLERVTRGGRRIVSIERSDCLVVVTEAKVGELGKPKPPHVRKPSGRRACGERARGRLGGEGVRPESGCRPARPPCGTCGARSRARARESRADLDDDASFLVYADWLSSQGDVRGELIRAQLELEQHPEDKPLTAHPGHAPVEVRQGAAGPAREALHHSGSERVSAGLSLAPRLHPRCTAVEVLARAHDGRPALPAARAPLGKVPGAARARPPILGRPRELPSDAVGPGGACASNPRLDRAGRGRGRVPGRHRGVPPPPPAEAARGSQSAAVDRGPGRIPTSKSWCSTSARCRRTTCSRRWPASAGPSSGGSPSRSGSCRCWARSSRTRRRCAGSA